MIGLANKTLLAILAVAICGCFSADLTRANDADPVRLEIAISNHDLEVTVRNTGAQQVLLHKPTEFSLLPDDPGLEIVLHSKDGKQQELCSFVEPSGNTAQVYLPPDRAVTRKIGLDYLAKLFCLGSGEYKIQAILHRRGRADGMTKIESPTMRLIVRGTRP